MNEKQQEAASDNRLSEIKERQEEIWSALSNGKQHKRSVAHAVIKAQHRDIKHLLSLLQQPVTGERCAKCDAGLQPIDEDVWRCPNADETNTGCHTVLQVVKVAATGAGEGGRPKIICLCGSTRFVQTWIDEYQRLSDEGNTVLTVARMPPRPNLQHDEPELKARLDTLHLRKIDLADEVFVLDVGGYIGASTKREIEYAIEHGKPVWYLSGTRAPATVVEGESPYYVHIKTCVSCGAHGMCSEGAQLYNAPTPVQPVAAPSDVDELLFRIAVKDCEHLAAGMRDCSDELPFADWCIVCQSRGLIQKYSRPSTPTPGDAASARSYR